MPADDSVPSLGPRLRAILRRRSYRSFRPDPLPAAALSALREVLAAAPSFRGARSGYAVLIDDVERVAGFPEAVTAGLVGKVNPWLRRSRPPAYLVVAGDSRHGLRDGDRHYYNIDGAVAGQLAVLEAAGRGIGTCWMAGFHEPSVARAAGLPDGHRPLAVIPIGFPAVGPESGGSLFGRGWDRAAQRLISGRRKPLERIAFRGRFGNPWIAAADDRIVERNVEGAAADFWPGLGGLRPTPAFADEAVPTPQISALLLGARWAPSAENSQIARHVVVEGRAAVAELAAAAFPGVAFRIGDLPPLAILALGAPFPLRARTREQPFFLIDVPIAVTNLIVGAADFGLGWQVAVSFDHRAAARCVGAPDDHEAVALVGLGTPSPRDGDGATSPLDQLVPPLRAGGGSP